MPSRELTMNCFKPHPSQQSRHISTSEVEDCVYLDELRAGTRIIVQTAHRQYLLETRGGCKVLLSGHPKYCPEPLEVTVQGAICGTPRRVTALIRPGLCLLFLHPSGRIIRTSRVREVRKLSSDVRIGAEGDRGQVCRDDRVSERGGRR